MSNQNQFYDQNNQQNNYWQAPPPPPKDYNSSSFAPTAPPPTYGVPKNEGQPIQDTSYDFQGESQQQTWDINNFSNRQSFIKKVYMTLSVQLLVTFIPIVLCGFLVDEDYTPSSGLFWSAWALQLGMFFVLCCGMGIARKFPANVIFLSVFTLVETYYLTVITLYYKADAVFMAVGGTFGISIAVTIMVSCTKYDFTKLLPAMFMVLLSWCLMSFWFIIFWSEALQVVYGIIGVTIFTIFLAIDTKLLLGGGKYEWDEDDYIFACLNLYLDIINIFMYLLSIFGAGD